jgi:hypothetical protein
MKNLLFHLKTVKKGTHKAQVGAGSGSGSGSFLKVGAKAEALSGLNPKSSLPSSSFPL